MYHLGDSENYHKHHSRMMCNGSAYKYCIEEGLVVLNAVNEMIKNLDDEIKKRLRLLV